MFKKASSVTFAFVLAFNLLWTPIMAEQTPNIIEEGPGRGAPISEPVMIESDTGSTEETPQTVEPVEETTEERENPTPTQTNPPAKDERIYTIEEGPGRGAPPTEPTMLEPKPEPTKEPTPTPKPEVIIPKNLEAAPTTSTVMVNEEQIAFDAYLIDGNNYFKLRDLAYAVNNTIKQFEVGYDGAVNAITLTSGISYTPVGGEMDGKGNGVTKATPTDSKIIKDGIEVYFTAYLIDGNNYFKLRDIGEAFDFGVEWDGVNNTIVIDTNKSYTP